MATGQVKTSELQEIPFPIPGATSDKLFAQILNTDTNVGPVAAVLFMEAGCRIPAHIHHKTTELLYVLEGDFIKKGISYGPGAFFANSAGQVHGPHESRHGCKVLFVQPHEVDPSDFEIAD
ncbi:MAG: cupin domain-containing protein [Cytophagales bacterium]|nr:cupin domain-containing protein [Cytophagales bacterium]